MNEVKTSVIRTNAVQRGRGVGCKYELRYEYGDSRKKEKKKKCGFVDRIF